MALACSTLAVVATAVLLPGPQPAAPADVAADFTPAQLARASQLHAAMRPWQVAALVSSVAVAALALWFTRRTVPGSTPGNARWWVAAGAACAASQCAAAVPSLALHRVMAAAGLDVRTTGGWMSDAAKAAALTTVVALAAGAVLSWALRRASAAALVVPGLAVTAVLVAGLLLPVVVEPMFARFTPLPSGPLRTELLDVAERAGIPVRDVLVADASRRTTTLNAYVSGYGPTRRVVLYDTVVEAMPRDEVAMIVAHELGHVARGDVWRNTVVGALWAAAAAAALCAMAAGAAGAEVAAVLLALSVMGGAIAPVANAVSRAEERRADAYALGLASSSLQVDAFARMMHRLALANASSLEAPRWAYLMWATHPLVPERIAQARAEAQQRGWVPTPPMADTGTP